MSGITESDANHLSRAERSLTATKNHGFVKLSATNH
jgi:hypothetical protein